MGLRRDRSGCLLLLRHAPPARSYLNDKGELDLTNDAMKAAFQSYADLVAKDKVAPLFAPSGNTLRQHGQPDVLPPATLP